MAAKPTFTPSTDAALRVEPLLPWLGAPLADALRSQRGHATLVHAGSGVGVLPFVLALAQAWVENKHRASIAC